MDQINNVSLVLKIRNNESIDVKMGLINMKRPKRLKVTT